jgi:hypothetical protein
LRGDTDVAITGWDKPALELTLDGDQDQCTAEWDNDTLALTSQVALALHIPKTTPVHIQQVSGDLLLRELDGEITVDTSHGDLSIRGGKAQLSIQEIHGSLTAKGLSGKLTADQVHGDTQLVEVHSGQLNQVHGNLHARSIANDLVLGDVSGDIGVRGINGSLKIENGHGNLQAHDLRGGLQADHVANDLSLKAYPSPGQIYRAHTGGAIRARFPADTSARFNLRSSSLVSAQLPTVERQEPTHVVGQAGAGEASVVLEASDDLLVQIQDQSTDEFDPWHRLDSISARIEAEVAQHLGKMSIDAKTQREIDKAIRQAEQELAQAQRHLEREMQHAQERARRAQEQAAKAAKRAQQRIARRSRRWGVPFETGGLFGPPPPRRRDRPKPSHASEEEQLTILKMLQEKKITVTEAEELLEALEG